LDIQSENNSVKLYLENDSSISYIPPVTLKVERSPLDLKIIAKNDAVVKYYIIKHQYSNSFLYGNFFLGMPFSYLIDLLSNRRFTYPQYIYLNFDKTDSNSIGEYDTWVHQKKNTLITKFGIPLGNNIYLNKGNGYSDASGFFLFTSGFEFYFSPKMEYGLNTGLITDYPMPVPMGIDVIGDYENNSAFYINLHYGGYYKALHYNFGIQYTVTHHNSRRTFYDSIGRETQYVYSTKFQNNFGLSLSSYYEIDPYLAINVNFMPSFIVYNKHLSLHYSHTLFVELVFFHSFSI
jgi:hypothetical protein